jgi:hypothetical protein
MHRIHFEELAEDIDLYHNIVQRQISTAAAINSDSGVSFQQSNQSIYNRQTKRDRTFIKHLETHAVSPTVNSPAPSLTIRRARQERRQRRELVLVEPLRVLVPRVLVRLLEAARALAHRRRDRRREVRQLGEHARQQRRHPALDRVRVAVHERADAQHARVQPPDRARVPGRLLVRQLDVLDQAHEAVLRRSGSEMHASLI